jgi:hypothetical protein
MVSYKVTTYGTISLFTSSLSNTLDREKATLIEHFENSLVKNEKATGVDTADFSLKHDKVLAYTVYD